MAKRRVLGSARLSHDTDSSTSVERQQEDIARRVHADRDTLVHIAVDTDVSGWSVSVFDRPELGPWLTDPALIAKWDTIMVAKLDRLSRSVRDFGDLLEWCKEHGKNVVSLDGEVNTDTATGWLHVQIIMTFAEFERRRMSERRLDAARKIASRKGWHGGVTTPWGYRPVRIEGVWLLEPDPGQVPMINEIAQEVINGKAVLAVADERGMDAASLARRLRRPDLYGAVLHKGETVYGDDGMPLLREPVIDRPTWDKLQAALDRNSRGRGLPRDSTPWIHVVYCDVCGHEMYLQSYTNRVVRNFYHKKSLKAYKTGEREFCPIVVNARSVMAQLDARVLRIWRGQYAVESVEIPGEDRSEELENVERAIADWESKAVQPGASVDSILRILDGLNARRQAIIDVGVVTDARVETVMTDVSLEDLWLGAEDDHEKGRILRSMGYRIYVRKAGYGKASIRIQQGSKSPREAMREYAERHPDELETDLEIEWGRLSDGVPLLSSE